MSCRLLAALHLNRLQRKVLLVVLVIIVVPTLITGVLSASWIAGRMEASIGRWIREAAQVNSNWLNTVNKNGRLFADLFDELVGSQPRFPNLLCGQLEIKISYRSSTRTAARSTRRPRSYSAPPGRRGRPRRC